MSDPPSEIIPLLIGVALVLLPIVVILVPLLWVKRLIVHLEVVDRGGQPARGVAIRGVRNSTGAATSATGDGHLTSGQLYPVSDSLGETDDQGRFLATYYLRNFHTLLIGPRTVFVDHVRRRMSATRAARVEVNASAADPLDFSGGAFKNR